MKMICVQVSNTNDEVTQKEWGEYVRKINASIEAFASSMHFHGARPTHDPWQNVCWVFTVQPSRVKVLRENLLETRLKYKQNYVAWFEGETELI